MRKGLLALAGLTIVLGGCKSEASKPAATEVVGQVIDLNGSVSATREESGEQRALTLEASVYADDVIETSAGASAVIRLGHNNADWQLGENLKMRVDKSAAWRAPKRNAAPLVSDREKDESFAAGRHSEREAAEGAATARPNAAQPPAATQAEPPAAKQAEKPRKRSTPAPKRAPKPSSKPKAFKDKQKKLEVKERRAKTSGSKPPPGGTRGGADSPRDDVMMDAESAQIGSSQISGRDTVKAAIMRCAKTNKPTGTGDVMVTITVDTKGKVTKVGIGAPAGFDGLKTCVRKQLIGKTVSGVAKRATATVTFK